MSYTKRGPFINASPTGPWVDADFFNNLEAAVAGVAGGVYVAPPATGNVTTDTANLRAAVTAAQNGFQDLYLPGSQQSYVINTGLTWNLAKGSIRGIGQIAIDCSQIPSGPALTVTANMGVTTSGVYSHGSIQHEISGITMFGPDVDYNQSTGSGAVDGIFFTDVGNGDNGTLSHLKLYGFRDGITYGDNVWLVNHYKVSVEHAHRYAVNGTQGANAGENMHFYGCVFSGGNNAAKTAAGLYTPPTGADSDFFFTGCSFDYNNIHADIEGHHVEFFGCHFEDLNNGPMFTVSNTAGNSQTDIGFHGCTFADTNPGTRTSPLVVVPATNTSDHVQIAFLGGKAGSYNKGQTLFQNLSTAAPTVKMSAINVDQGSAAGGGVSQYGGAVSQLADGNFESGTAVASGLGGWSLDASANFYSPIVHTGTYSLRRGGTGTAFQIAPITPRQPLSLSGYINVNNAGTGSATFQVQFLAADRSTVLSTVTIVSVSAIQAWTGYQRRLMPPSGAVYASVQWTSSSYTGTAELDDVQLVCL